MKNTALIGLVAVIAIFVMTNPTNAQKYIDKMAQSGMPFLAIDVNSRTSAMGSASVCVIQDASAMFSNLAGLALIEGADISFTVTNWIADIKQYSGAAAYTLGKWGTFGASFIWMDYGTFTETAPYTGYEVEMRNIGYERLGDFTVSEYAVGISYARRVSNQFSFGGQIKYAYEGLYQNMVYDYISGRNVLSKNREQVYALDFGTLYYTGWKDLRFGMSIRNFSRQCKFVEQRFELPLTMTMGLAMNVMSLLQPADSNQKLTMAVDWLHPRDWNERYHVGVEYALAGMLYARLGYKFNYSEEGFTGGLGVAKAMGNYEIKLDYAYRAFGEFFGSVQQLGIGISIK
ncbi:MAG: PorV/PorQ family protein [candidate division KSB1 bacterium]|nr:PorV/PorQ family protein [candidate division KSB1 bacterium]